MLQTFVAIAALSAAACTVGYAPDAEPIHPLPPEAGERTPWTGEISCVGSRDLVIRDAIVEVGGDGPTAVGSCRITVVNSTIIAGGVGAVVRGSGSIHLYNSHL
jgi:hypothetical protein